METIVCAMSVRCSNKSVRQCLMCIETLKTTHSFDRTMASVDLDRALAVAISAAETAGKLIKQGFDQPKTVEHKGKVDLVTQTVRMHCLSSKHMDNTMHKYRTRTQRKQSSTH